MTPFYPLPISPLPLSLLLSSLSPPPSFPSLQVSLTPNSDWGGEGSLGCGIGYGYLHRLPAHKVGGTAEVDVESGGAPGNTGPISFPPTEGYSDVSLSFSLSLSLTHTYSLSLSFSHSHSLSPLQVPLSVPSNPSTPSTLSSTAKTSTDVVTQQVQAGMEELRLNEDVAPIAPPTLPNTLTPAPVTVVRSSGPPQPTTEEQPPGGLLTSGAVGSPYRMTNAQFSTTTTTTASPQSQPPLQQQTQIGVPTTHIPAATSTILPTFSLGGSAVGPTGGFLPPPSSSLGGRVFSPASQTVSGLPSVPPTISFPSVAPKISLMTPGILSPPQAVPTSTTTTTTAAATS